MKTHIIPLFIAAMLAPLFFASCQVSEVGIDDTGGDMIEFHFSIPAQTRAQIAEDGSGNFEEGDRISLYIGTAPANQHILTFQNGRWTPEISKEELGDGLVTINACYPAECEEYRISTDQNGDGYRNSDILWSHKTINMTELSGNTIDLSFLHGMHRLKINLESESGELPSDMEIAVFSALDVSFNYESGSVQVENGSEYGWIVPARNSSESGTLTAIVAPQPLSDLQSGDGWIRITSEGKTAYYPAPDDISGSTVLESGKESHITLHIKKEDNEDPGTDEGWINRKAWVYGITSPVFNPDDAPILSSGSDDYPIGEWYIVRLDWGDGTYSDRYRITWKDGCGWYDCNKTYDWDGADDSNMCWAASSSNIMHWWIEHNAAYIEAYDNLYGDTEYFNEYPRPSADFLPSPEKSEIFNLYVRTFVNRGAGEGVHWFINGTSGYGTSGLKDNSMAAFEGYFKEVFTSDDKIYSHYPSMSRDRFNEVLKDALANKKAIAFVTNGNHNMTIWGAEFDEEGYASYIYYVDNNPSGELDPGGAVCVREEISYRKDDVMNLQDQTYVGARRITSLGIVDLKQDVWKAAFPKVSPQNK